MLELVSNFKERLKIAVAESNLSKTQIAKKSGISKSLLSHYLAGDTEAGNVRLKALADVLNVNPVWLMGYNAPKNAKHEDTSDVREVIDSYLDMMDNEKLRKTLQFIKDYII